MNIIKMFYLLMQICGVGEIIYYITDYIGFVKKRTHIYLLRDGTHVIVRNNTTDRGEMVQVMSGNEYGDVIKHIKEYYKHLDGVIDAGGNIGLFTLWLNKENLKFNKTIIIEPDPDNFSQLKRNIKLNKIKDCILYEKALFSTDKGVLFNSDLNPDSRRIDNKSGKFVGSITLKKIFKINNIKKLGVLKLDIEGGEWFLMNEENKKIFEKIGIIVMEYHMRYNNKNFSRIEEYFNNFYFEKVAKKDEEKGLVILINKCLKNWNKR